MKSMDVILGVASLEIDNETRIINEEILSPRSSLRDLQKQSELRMSFSQWMDTM